MFIVVARSFDGVRFCHCSSRATPALLRHITVIHFLSSRERLQAKKIIAAELPAVPEAVAAAAILPAAEADQAGDF